MTEIIIGLGGVILGIVLTEIFTWFRTTRIDQRQAEAIRTALLSEITINIEELKDYQENPESKEKLYTYQVIWSNNTATAIASLLPIEVGVITSFYSQLSALEHLDEYNERFAKGLIMTGEALVEMIDHYAGTRKHDASGLKKMLEHLEAQLASKEAKPNETP